MRTLTGVAIAAVFLFSSGIFAYEEPSKPVAKSPTLMKKEMNLPPGAQVPTQKKESKPSPKEQALANQLAQLEKRRDQLIERAREVDSKRLSTADPAERKQLDQQKLALVKELDAVVTKRAEVYKAWQNAAMERWRRDNPEAFQTPPNMPPGMTMSPQVIAKQIEIAKEQLAKLKKEGKPDTDPQVKMYQERIQRYTQMLKASAAKPPAAPKPPAPQK